MSFLDKTGLAYFYSKLKNKFVQSVNRIQSDDSGNVNIVSVATANNLTSPDNITTYDTFVIRSTSGDNTIPTGDARLLYIEGKSTITGRVQESIIASATNNLDVSVDAATWRASGYGGTSGNYNFNYLSNSNTWSPSIDSTGITVMGIHESIITTSFSGNITGVTVTKDIWETQITISGIYHFIYDGNNWKLNNNNVILSNYGIDITGTPVSNDTVTISYETATPNSTITIQYVKAERGEINNITPTGFKSTGLNSYDKNTMTLANMSIIDNVITTTEGKYICWCPALGGIPNGYVAYSNSEAIENIGWCANIPTESATVITNGEQLTSKTWSIEFNTDGYVIVVATSINDICIHPRWSGEADQYFSFYEAPSNITFPTTGSLHGQSGYTLPLAEYGMPSIGSIADILDFDKQEYIQNIGHENFTEINLAQIQALNVDYDYDNTNIFYVLSTPIVYKINVEDSYRADDYGTERFLDTTLPVPVQILYGENLRDKLRFNVELKKLTFQSITVTSNAFSSDSTYAHYGYKVTIPLTGVNSTMMPQVILGVTEATTGIFAPISQTYDGGVYLYASKVLSSSFTIPLIICWQNYE